MNNRKSLKIAILAHSLRVAGGLAVGKSFIKVLKRVAPQHQYLIFVPADLGYEEIGMPYETNLVVYKGSPNPLSRIIYDNKILPKIIKGFKADVIFGMGNAGVKGIDVKQAVLLQDSHMLYDESRYANEVYMGKLKWRYQKRKMRNCLDDIDLIFCQTPVMKDRFAKTFNWPMEKIKLMPNAVSEFAKLCKNDIAVPETLKDKKFFNLFYLTKFYAHKNLEVLIDLFENYPAELRDVRCIITVLPEQHKKAPKFLSNIKKYGLENKIVNVGPLKQEELAGYFLNCDGLLFPTLLESFSGTYLEAMHFGVPILTSDLDFAKYICDDAAVYFDPWDVSDIAQKIIQLKDNNALKQELVENGKQRIAVFFKTWEEIAADVIKELEMLCSK
jgi:glycosyltransferase involved in cell wall biosynthesis